MMMTFKRVGVGAVAVALVAVVTACAPAGVSSRIGLHQGNSRGRRGCDLQDSTARLSKTPR